MRGDPREFPHEIRGITNKTCNLILFPWRQSQYVETLFWGTIRSATAPIALLVMLDTYLTPTIADIAIESGTGIVGEMNRNRSHSAAVARSRAMSVSSDPETNSTVEDKSKYDGISPPTGVSPSSTPQGSLLSRKKSTSVPNDDVPVQNQNSSSEGSRQSVTIKSMLCVITASTICTAIFPLVLRFAERKSVEITVLVTSDRRTFPDMLIESLAAFRRIVENTSNVTVTILTTPSEDIESILSHCTLKMYDLIVFGFSDICGMDSGGIVDPIPLLTRGHRSASMSFSTSALDGTGTGYIKH